MEDRSALIALAENGDIDRAELALQRLTRAHRNATLRQIDVLPEMRAALFLSKHQPQQALDALEPARQIEEVTVGPQLLRGRAYLALGKPALAVTDIQKITTRIYADTLSPLFPLGELGSARADALAGQTLEAREHYERLFALWKNADPDIPLLNTARLAYRAI